MKKFNFPIGEVLKRLRNEHNLTQEELSLNCNLERNKQEPGHGTIFSIAKAFNMEASELIKEIEKNMKN
ncbi:helix-turn-helix transcriptional regulator [Paenibacillus sp. BSR1-1]|uniref:helix-turn-helix domain-containing protein n=1 Tax=Paenibacillus sp. BSR1-1 TaxID=3020845 RepID=UPI0025B15234|nr:helix-turn-helix transcriptional regulator [Paenibacillus sp. BSR1-1]MDN3019210.1 helix-turn-helix transcriptional regulator [Paenibacillus sp. BSR1-1]